MTDPGIPMRAVAREEQATPAVTPSRSSPPSRAPIFAQDWWREAAVPGAWRRIDVRWDRSLVGSMAFHTRRRYGLRIIAAPPYTRSLTPILDLPTAKPARALQNTLKVLGQLLAQLPQHDRFETCLEPDSPVALPFALLGYGVAQTYTFRNGPLAPGLSLNERMHPKTRNVIAKAARSCTVEHSTDISRFFRLHYRERSRDSLLDEPTVSRLFAAAAARESATLLIAIDAGGLDVGACAVVWDHTTLYYWLSTRDHAASGVNSLLIVNAAELATRFGKVFDLDGFASKESGLFLSRFGLEPVVRPYINKSGRLWKAMNTLTAIVGRDRFDRNYRF